MGTVILLAAVFVLTAAFSFVVAGRDTPNAVALPIAAGALTPMTALWMTAVMRMVGAIMGVSTIQFAAEFIELVPWMTGFDDCDGGGGDCTGLGHLHWWKALPYPHPMH